VAELLGVTPETVLRWRRRGELPAVKLPGGAIRFHLDELELWLAGRATGRTDAHDQESADSPEAHPPTSSLTGGTRPGPRLLPGNIGPGRQARTTTKEN
jgi:excisionase family DNA binding protein